MSKINLYSAKSKTVSKLDLPKEFAGDVNIALLTQAIHVYRDRKHAGLSKTKTRSEVKLTKAKVYRQKGTGNARHGAKSAPIFVGGGTAHGPKGIKRVLSLPKKMKRKALLSAFAAKNKKGDVIAAEGLANLKKTKEADDLIKKIVEGEKAKAGIKMLILVSDKSKVTRKFFKNIKTISTLPYSDANAYDTYLAGKVILDSEIFSKKKETSKK